jgi:hypothetical protein
MYVCLQISNTVHHIGRSIHIYNSHTLYIYIYNLIWYVVLLIYEHLYCVCWIYYAFWRIPRSEFLQILSYFLRLGLLYDFLIKLLTAFCMQFVHLNPLGSSHPIYRRAVPLPPGNVFNIFIQKIYLIFLDLLQSPFIPLQNVLYFIMLPSLIHKIFIYHINGALKFNCPASASKG